MVRRMSALVSDFKNRDGEWERTFTVNKIRYQTIAYRLWIGMRNRCLGSEYIQTNRPTYVGCYMSENFKNFQFFASWLSIQVGYGVDKYELDKDILIPGNKEYGEGACVLVPAALNTFLCSNNAIRGALPQGISYHKNSGKYLAQMNKDGKGTHIGYYLTIEEASAAYKAAKEAEARRWHRRLLAGEFVVDPRVIERMRTWAFDEVMQSCRSLEIIQAALAEVEEMQAAA